MPELNQDETRTYTYISENYNIRPIGPSCYEVMLGERRGYLGVNPQGTEYVPYAFTMEPWQASPEGVRDGIPCGSNLSFALNQLCSKLFELTEPERMQSQFDEDAAAAELRAGIDLIIHDNQG